ncbi:MAG: hypothetical protein M3Y24_08340 [Acidobacteriota bacterium]|nr:hypothetical protein [Acidobacteriota bacterium]
MKDTQYDAIAKVTMHGREHIVILRPSEHGIVLHTMYFVSELNRERETSLGGPAKFDKKEIDLAKQLIDTLAVPFEPEQFHDQYKENVEKLIEAKRNGEKVTPIKQPKTAPVIDLMQALQQSLAKNKNTRAPEKESASGHPAAKTSKTAAKKASPRKRASKVA